MPPAPSPAATSSRAVSPNRTPLTVLCFSHLRWDFVFQRPQQLMSRFARTNRVVFWEEPKWLEDGGEPRLALTRCASSGVTVAVPELPKNLDANETTLALRKLLDQFVLGETTRVVRWYYTPMMLPFSEHLDAACTVYDCMDELANFKFAPADLLTLEQRLIDQADLVFTGGASLYEAKKHRHPSVHLYPSSVDAAHFARARRDGAEPADLAALPRPRLGFYGVIDERMDLDLVAAVADAHPEWSLVLVGPVVKIEPEALPRRANLHYLGGKTYDELPDYLRGWDVALMPFAVNEATRFISPTKTPEYLAAGRPVVSTPITDVVSTYGALEAVAVAAGPAEFIAACERALALAGTGTAWLTEADALLAQSSWDNTAAEMWRLIEATQARRRVAGATLQAVPGNRPKQQRFDVMVVGAGFAGSVMAERLAAQGKKVLVVDRRPHVAGNAYDRLDEAGVLMHQYGPHIFHTNSKEIFDYLSQFTRWRLYEHRVLAEVDGQLVPIPINRTTLNKLYGLSLTTDEEAAAYLASRAEPVATVRTSEDVVVSAVGRELYEKFFRGYTRKQWGLDPSELDKAVTARVPTRTNTDDRYFGDKFQYMPADGYTRMFERMLDNPNIELLLGVDYREARLAYRYDHLVFTGPIDEYFDYCYGKLPYRSLRFRHETVDQEQFQPVAVINYPDEAVPYTRVTEYKHLTGQTNPRSSITYEYPAAEGDPYYPIPREENQALFKRYEALAGLQNDVTFVGRLATYRYYNMDQIVGQALATFRRTFVEGKTRDTRRSAVGGLAKPGQAASSLASDPSRAA